MLHYTSSKSGLMTDTTATDFGAGFVNLDHMYGVRVFD